MSDVPGGREALQYKTKNTPHNVVESTVQKLTRYLPLVVLISSYDTRQISIFCILWHFVS